MNHFKSGIYSVSKIYTKKEVDKISEEIAFRLPSKYVEFITQTGAGFFTINYDKTMPCGSKFETFYLLDTVLYFALGKSGINFPNDLIPFGSDNIGDFICFHKKKSQIILFSKDDLSTATLAPDFGSLLKLI